MLFCILRLLLFDNYPFSKEYVVILIQIRFFFGNGLNDL